jgi:hypothetical protein
MFGCAGNTFEGLVRREEIGGYWARPEGHGPLVHVTLLMWGEIRKRCSSRYAAFGSGRDRKIFGRASIIKYIG